MTRVKRFLTSRISRLRKAPQTEAALWDHLDTCGIDFRASMADLITRYGSAPAVWSEKLDICVMADAAPFIPGLAHPPAFQFSPASDLSAPPRDFFCAVQASPDHRINYAKAIAALVRKFGDGTVGTASNTASRDWQFGHASLSCTVWPPDSQQPGRNTRHEIFPETITEAAIWMAPAYRVPLSKTQLAQCSNATLLPTPTPPREKMIPVGQLTHDWPSTLPPLDPGLYLSTKDAALLKQTTPGLIDILPRTWMHDISLDRITGGRGGREAIATLRYGPPEQPDLPSRSMTLCDLYGDPNALDAFANALCERLSLPLDVYEGPMD